MTRNKMVQTSSSKDLILRSSGDRLVRMLGWSILGFLLAFLLNNFLSVVYDFPGPISLIYKKSVLGTVQLAIYVLIILLFNFICVIKTQNTLRLESERLHKFNVFLIRWFFLSILFIGVVDVSIAVLRVEKLLPLMTSDTVVSLLNRPKFVGGYIHIPIFAICFFAAILLRTLGFTWLALLIVIAELMIVITRFVFSYEQPFMADLVRYWYAALFLFASAYTLYDEGHVRVDIAYAGLSSQTKGLLNAIGSIILGVSTSLSIVVISFNGKFSIINKPLMSFEVSQTGTVGMFIKYQLALFLGIFGVTMVIQFVSYFFESVADYRNYAGKRSVVASGSH